MARSIGCPDAQPCPAPQYRLQAFSSTPLSTCSSAPPPPPPLSSAAFVVIVMPLGAAHSIGSARAERALKSESPSAHSWPRLIFSAGQAYIALGHEQRSCFPAINPPNPLPRTLV